MRLLAAVLLLAACEPKPAPARDNRAVQFISLVRPHAKCYQLATSDYAPDTAYCLVTEPNQSGSSVENVYWVSAGLASPPDIRLIGQRPVEQPQPAKVAPPTPVADGGVK